MNRRGCTPLTLPLQVTSILIDPARRPKELSELQALALSDAMSAPAASTEGSSGASTGTGIPPLEFHLSFQSRVGPVQWLKPYTEETLEKLGEDGVKNLVVVPISFVSEHVETLEEIDMEYRELAEGCGITNWRRVPALNTDATFIKDMADLVMDALEAPAGRHPAAYFPLHVSNPSPPFASPTLPMHPISVCR